MSLPDSLYGIDLRTNAVPLLVVPVSLKKFIVFAYASRFKNPQDPAPAPYLIEQEINGPVPDPLRPFLVPYPIDLSKPDPSLYPRHLRYMTVINSTLSGTQKSSELYFSILLPLLKRFNMSHVYVATSSKTSIFNHACSFSDPSTVVLLTGDTSISEFVNCLQPRDAGPEIPLTLILIPTGTANALANSSGLDSVQKAVSRMFLGSPQPMASFPVEFPPGTCFIHNEPEPKPSSTHLGIQSGLSVVTTPDAPPGVHSSLYNHFFKHTGERDNYFDPSLVIHAIAALSWAAHASLVADSDSPQFRVLGEARFQKAAETNMSRPQKYRGQIILGDLAKRHPNSNDTNQDLKLTYLNPFDTKPNLDGLSGPLSPATLPVPYTIPSNEHSYLLFTLASNVEKTYAISPDSHPPSDLTLHLVHTDYTSNERLSQMMMAPYTRSAHLSLGNDVQYFALSYKDPMMVDRYAEKANDLKTKFHYSSQPVATSYSNPISYTQSAITSDKQRIPNETKLEHLSPIAAEIYPQETDPKYIRWCIDGTLLNVPKDMGPVKVRLPTYSVRGWNLFLVT